MKKTDMKKDGLILTALSALLLLAGCSKSEVPTDGVIRLRSGVCVTVGSKAAIGNADSFTAQICGWESGDLTATPSWENTQVFTAGTTDVPFDLAPLRYYSQSIEIPTTICGWYPQGKPEGGRVMFQNPDGAVDIMFAPPIAGSLDRPVDESLLFSHLTALLRFRIISNGWNPSEKIMGITLRDVALPTGLDMVARALLTAPTADFALRNIPSEGLVPQEQIADAGDVVMIAPINGNVLYVDVQTTVRKYENIHVTISDMAYSAGTAYTATLTFSSNQDIKIGSTVDQWAQGTSGGEVID